MDPLGDLNQRASFLENLEDDFAIVPHEGEWHAPGQVEAGSGIEGEIGAAWEALKESVRGNDVKGGREAAERLAGAVRQATEAQNLDLPWLELDAVYQSHHPFAKSAFFYLLAALCYGAVLLFGWRRLAWVGYGFLALGLTEEVLGIIARWILAGQAPLSNMYESFTFATAGVVLVALIFEATHRIRLAGLGGALLGFIFMIVAHNLPIFDTRIRPLVPALQSSWLTYHVVTIMLSYSAFALSFFVGMCYLIKDSLGGDRSRLRGIRHLPSLNALDVFNYKIIAVGFPLLTAGIILGAVWANTAWGRPWGFDPKETWSAITWLVYAIYLHVRFFAGWKGRRAAVVALIGFGCVLFTYFGVNYLLPSLHSYVG
ncbi:c-type cytochrome biogenesis protein CcsB [bacterium]|nr:c-type cytochrome biogenesis protein CcsB [bacterium]